MNLVSIWGFKNEFRMSHTQCIYRTQDMISEVSSQCHICASETSLLLSPVPFSNLYIFTSPLYLLATGLAVNRVFGRTVYLHAQQNFMLCV